MGKGKRAVFVLASTIFFFLWIGFSFLISASPAEAQDIQGSLSLSPASGSYQVGDQNITIKPHLAGEGQEYEIAFASVELSFDKALLQLTGVDVSNSPLGAAIDVPDTPAKIAQANQDGSVKVALGQFSGTMPTTPFDLFELQFEAIAAGTAVISYTDYEVNIYQMTNNVLTITTTDGSYEITGGS